MSYITISLTIDKWFPSSQICSNCAVSTGKKDIDRDINARFNIKNYGLGQVDTRNTVGTIQS